MCLLRKRGCEIIHNKDCFSLSALLGLAIGNVPQGSLGTISPVQTCRCAASRRSPSSKCVAGCNTLPMFAATRTAQLHPVECQRREIADLVCRTFGCKTGVESEKSKERSNRAFLCAKISLLSLVSEQLLCVITCCETSVLLEAACSRLWPIYDSDGWKVKRALCVKAFCMSGERTEDVLIWLSSHPSWGKLTAEAVHIKH